MSSGRKYRKLRAQAEGQYEKGSFAEAHATYLQAAALKLPGQDARWVEFRVAETHLRSTAPPGQTDFASLARSLPPNLLHDAQEGARGAGERAYLHYLTAAASREQQGDWPLRQRIPDEYEGALKAGKKVPWYGDLLFEYASWMCHPGRAVQSEGGRWSEEPDLKKAVELYRRLLSEFKEGESPHWREAQGRVAAITNPDVSLGDSHYFLPGSEVQIDLRLQNVKRVDFDLYALEIDRDISLTRRCFFSVSYLQASDLEACSKVHSWSQEIRDPGDHRSRVEALHLENDLPPGTYCLEARGAGRTARSLLQITDVSIVLKTSGRQAFVYVCNVCDGSPLSGAKVRLWEEVGPAGSKPREHSRSTDEAGLACFDFPDDVGPDRSRSISVSASAGECQAFTFGYCTFPHEGWGAPRVTTIFTDRPVYRPGETSRWKLVMRRQDGEVCSTPVDEAILYQIYDAKGGIVREGEAKLNAFGSAWGTLDLTEEMPVGEYRIHLQGAEQRESLGEAILFRLEEYRRPEFEVTIGTPTGPGRPGAFRLGETVPVEIVARYFSGAPVAAASVEVFVTEQPYSPGKRPPRDFPWPQDEPPVPGGPPRVSDAGPARVERLETDAEGRVTLPIDTPPGGSTDLEYCIQARVTDAARREVTASGSVRVGRQRCNIHLRPAHRIWKGGEEVLLEFEATDPNARPVAVAGTVTVTRERSFEVWADPEGREVEGEELQRVQESHALFPPAPKRQGDPGWRLLRRGTHHHEVLSRKVETGAGGTGEFRFTPEVEGAYRVAWSGEEPDGPPITAETMVWVADGEFRDLGYAQDALQIILDQESTQGGEKVPVVICGPARDAYLLVTVERDEIYSHRVVHLEGTAGLVWLEIGLERAPNVFLSAVMVKDRQILTDTELLLVPPAQNLLDLDVKLDRESYKPREKGTLAITARDPEGKPVTAEVAVGVVDESVYAIQEEYADDPRKPFFTHKGPWAVILQSTLEKRHRKLVRGEDGRLVEVPWREGWRDGVEGDSRLDRWREGLYPPPPTSPDPPPMPVPNGPPPPEPPGPPDSPGPPPEVVVRTDFRPTAAWFPGIVTDGDGRAEVEVRFPDSLTAWRVTARGQSRGARVGIGKIGTRTGQPLMIRLQAPRFFVVGDSVTVSATVQNATDEPIEVVPSLEAEGLNLLGSLREGDLRPEPQGELKVLPGGCERVDWVVEAAEAGAAKIIVAASGKVHGDALEERFPVHEHGLEKRVSRSGRLAGNDVLVTLEIPKERRSDSTRLAVQVAPSIATAILDALPYLIGYPHGCTEQTMSRFLPTVITLKILEGLGLDREALRKRVLPGVGTRPAPGEGELSEIDLMVEKGLARLYDQQQPDGGWGWWQGGEGDPFMTAYVLWGLALARVAGLEVRREVVDSAAHRLDRSLREAEDPPPEMGAWILHALAAHSRAWQSPVPEVRKEVLGRLWEGRDDLDAYSGALLALGAHHLEDPSKAQGLLEDLRNDARVDRGSDRSIVQGGEEGSREGEMTAAHWGESGIYRRWSQSGVEATAMALRALLAIDPASDLIEPVVHWLVRNRRGMRWESTRDTALVVLALGEYLRERGLGGGGFDFELLVNGGSVVKRELTAEEALIAPSCFEVGPERLRDGLNEIRILRTRGEEALYFGAEACFFTLEEPVASAGSEIFVRREYWMLPGGSSRSGKADSPPEPLGDGDTVASGTRIRTEIVIEAKNDYEYLVFEDPKPGGFEAVELLSGGALFARELRPEAAARHLGPGNSGGGLGGDDYTDRRQWVYREVRDRKVALFIDRLPEGFWHIRYEFRAEVPGTYHALPPTGHAMYLPEVRCNGAEVRVTVT